MGARRPLRRIGAFVATLAVLLALPIAAGAHSGEESYVYLDMFDQIEGQVEFPIPDVNDVLGLDIPERGSDAERGITQNLSALQSYAADHLSIGDGTTSWPIIFDGWSLLEESTGSYVQLYFVVDQDFSTIPREFVVSYDGIMHEKQERSGLLLIANDFGSGTFNNEPDELLRYTAGNTSQLVDLGDSSFWKGITGVIGLGADHIRIGTDHILFILALVLPSVLVFRRPEGWEPAPTFGASLWRVLKIVTMFTLAHTITLTLGGFGIVDLPARPVETIIALSIALAALHNIRPLFVNREWLIAFVFGLFHGFGFAGLLSSLGLTQTRQFVSLLGFNVGIELGQAVVILLVFPSLFLLRRTRFYVTMMNVVSAALALFATGWAIDRAFGIDLNVDWVVDRLLLWPRSLVVLAVLTVVAAVFLYREREKGRLLPVAGESREPARTP